ncbi:MAG: GNAT family N-acetyltransferase [bacterium]
MSPSPFTIRPLDDRDRAWVLGVVQEWGADFVVSRGRRIYAARLPGFCAMGPDGESLGLATYEVTGDQCQLVTVHALRRHSGVGTALVGAVRDAAEAESCRRLWLITTNDNLDALRFYQRRDFELVAVHRDLREVARRLKPSIPLIGNFGIPIRDEIELELRLDAY